MAVKGFDPECTHLFKALNFSRTTLLMHCGIDLCRPTSLINNRIERIGDRSSAQQGLILGTTSAIHQTAPHLRRVDTMRGKGIHRGHNPLRKPI